ncbi:PREDICTED: uncharacterized protein LOC106556739 [Thamnophis sirtalis]|uniref:Uncharacterized protein LOC106556739 n=1 Tax=Thamnophis sirtalis TaxID=35019 RepID=A0A6I9Z4Q7_9SAUR|nr:PREDICTED: uncharacterized protein LOC106556739 [Thamnophis sirtalis]
MNLRAAGASLLMRTPSTRRTFLPPSRFHRSYSPGMADIISETIERGIAAGIKHRSSNHCPPRRSVSSSGSRRRNGDLSASSSHELPGTSSQPSVFREEERPARDSDLSEDEGLPPNPPTVVSLLFNVFFLSPRRLRVNIPSPKAQQGTEADRVDTTDPLFIQPKVEKEMIPSPRLFIDVVQNEWASPGTCPLPNTLDKRLYNVGPELTKALEVLSIDLPIIGLSSPNAASAASEEALRPEDERIKQTLVKGHQASVWAVRAGTSASFFSRSALLWLRQLHARLLARDSRACRDINKLKVALE